MRSQPSLREHIVRRAAALLAVIATTPMTAADASVCGRPGDAITVPPPVGVRAPRNVRPRVTMHAAWRTIEFCPPWPERRVGCAAGDFDLLLRASASATPIPVALRESKSGDLATVEIVPRAPLAAARRFEIVHVDRSEKSEARVIATFMTGDALDVTAPVWAGVTTVERFGEWPGEPPPKPRPGTGRVITLNELADCEGPGAHFRGASAATDDATRPEDLRYALWAAAPGTPIDYAAPPLAYLKVASRGHEFRVVWGTVSEPSDFSFPSGKKAQIYGLRAVDLAGNVSPPSEVAVTLR